MALFNSARSEQVAHRLRLSFVGKLLEFFCGSRIVAGLRQTRPVECIALTKFREYHERQVPTVCTT